MAVWRDIYIDFNTGTLLDESGGTRVKRPTIGYKAYPTWNVHLVTFDAGGNMIRSRLDGGCLLACRY